MEISSIIGLPELGIMEDPNFFNQWNISSIDATSLSAGSSFGETLQKSSISNSNSNPKTCMESERPAKQFKSNWNNNRNPQTSEAQFASNYSNLLSFVDSNYYTSQLGLVRPKMDMVCPKVESKIAQEAFGHQNFVFQDFHEGKMIGARPKHSTPHEHVLAERKRREKLSQRFIDLSALVPGLKKMDKASVLGDAIKYLKQMQEKVSSLEEEKNRKKTAESVVFVKKSILSNSDDLDTGISFDEALPEIEARVWERNVLIRVHCEKKKGVIEKTISEIEKLHLKVINTSALAFGSFVLDITIIAQMEVEFSMTVKDLVIELRSAFASFM